jgi:cysteinyl-tRNA synthetase
MASSLLGTETNGVIDIHSGGEDNIFPHHECEIAQSCCAAGEQHFARYWFHTRFLMVEGAKMSKRTGSFYTVRDLVQKGHSPAAIRLELIKTHYRSNANFTFQGLKDSQRQIARWSRLRAWLETHREATQPTDGPGPLETALPAFCAALENDLNIAGAIGVLNEAISQHSPDAAPGAGADGHRTYASELDALNRMDSVLGVLTLQSTGETGDVDVALVEEKIAERNEARANKDWAGADRLRDELVEMGVAIKDGAGGTTWERLPD